MKKWCFFLFCMVFIINNKKMNESVYLFLNIFLDVNLVIVKIGDIVVVL